MNPEDVPFTPTLPEYTWHLLTPEERYATAMAYEFTLRAVETLGLSSVSPDVLALLAELHARFTETTP